MTNKFNYKLMMDKYLTYSFLKLNDLPSLTNLRLKLESFFITNFDGFNNFTKGKNRIKEHSGYLLENFVHFL